MQDRIKEFMSRVVPWPSDKEGYVNLHWRAVHTRDPSKMYWGGKPFQKIDDFLSNAGWAVQQDFIKDIFFCTSLQSQAAPRKGGGLKVMRSKDLAVSLKAIWLDVDVKEPPKGYATIKDAVAAILKFVKDAALPSPSAMIGTGGGIHVYWISNRPLTPTEWVPYAEGFKALAINLGLRCDAGVTTDMARILRVPGTFNFKLDVPRPVRILGLKPAENDYDFDTSLSFIRGLLPAVRQQSHGTVFQSPASPKFSGIEGSLSDGIEREEVPLDPAPIFKGCGFLGEALKTGGKDYSQPMWNLSTLAATFMEKGHAFAHRMGSAHPGYTRETTDALWERKLRERRDRGLGWPSCAAIQASGSRACASCPHFAKGKSPLNLAAAPAAKTRGERLGSGGLLVEVDDDLCLPADYLVNDEGYICKVEPAQGKRGEAGETTTIQLFRNKLSHPYVHSSPKVLHFIATADKGKTSDVSITLGELVPGTDLWKNLQRQELVPIHYIKCWEFLMAWLSKIQEAKAAANCMPFGWYVNEEDGKRHGFVYGGVVMKDDKTEAPAGIGDIKIRELYSPVGSIKPWMDALKLITDQKRPELEAIVAAAFAAPLVVTPAEYSCMLSAWGGSGGFKSTAAKVGLAVWGHPKKTKEVTLSTARSVIHKMGEIRNLPLYWDEIKDAKAQQNVFDVFFTGTEGVGPSRLTSKIELRDRSEWQTMMVTCSNISFVDFLVKAQQTTDAGIYRVFEFETVPPPETAPGVVASMDASRITQELENNYGVMGLAYAKMLGSEPEDIDKFTKDVVESFAKEVDQKKPERYWSATCGTLLAGAKLANQLGATFDIPALHDFLIEQYYKNRARRVDEATEGGAASNTEEILTNFLRDNLPNTLYTDTFPHGKGKPPQVTVVFAPRLDAGKGIKVHWALKDRVLRFSRGAFRDYLTERNISPAHVIRGLKDHYGMEAGNATMGANTPYIVGQARLLCMPVPEGSSLEELMFAHRPQAEAPPVKVEQCTAP